MQIKCNKCSAVSDTAMPETYLEGEVELTFLSKRLIKYTLLFHFFIL